jgi:hypothetical protein
MSICTPARQGGSRLGRRPCRRVSSIPNATTAPARRTARWDPEQGAAAEVTGYGPIPAEIAHDILADTAGERC